MHPHTMSAPTEFLLASGSPRRRKLLAEAGWQFRVETAGVEEVEDGLAPAELVRTNAGLKAEAVAAQHPQALVLGSDTTVALANTILNKPSGPREARQMLQRLAGRTHQVHTAVRLLHLNGGLDEELAACNRVTFKPLNADTIERYLSKVHTLDKAGGYAIQEQGDHIIESYEEPLSSIIGLPIEAVTEKLVALGFDKCFRP